MTDDPAPRMRVIRSNLPIDAVAVFTDGVERLALNYAGLDAHQPFFRGMIALFEAAGASGVGGADIEATIPARLRGARNRIGDLAVCGWSDPRASSQPRSPHPPIAIRLRLRRRMLMLRIQCLRRAARRSLLHRQWWQ